jgi:death-on-curing protein
VLDAIHEAQLSEHGGAPGVRDQGLLESALARPRNKFVHENKVDLATLAAAYAFGLARNHGYVDGNERVAFMSAYVFLGLNGQDVDASELEAAEVIEGLAASRMSESALATWFRERLRRPEA